MRTRHLWLALALACAPLALSGCAGSTTVEQVWRSPEWQGSFDHVVIFGMSKRPGVRRGFEDAVAQTLRKAGVNATPSYMLFPSRGELTEDDIATTLREHDIDAALVARLVAIDTQQYYVAGMPYVLAGPWPNFYGFYHWAYGAVYSPGYSVEQQVVTVESNLYDVGSAELVWSGLSETIDPDDVEDAVRSYAKAMTKSLIRAGIVEAPS